MNLIGGVDMDGNNIEYRVYLVDNGQLDDFARGMVGRCQCWGVYGDIGEAAQRVKELAEEESMKEFCSAATPDVVMADIESAIAKECDGMGGCQSRLILAMRSAVGSEFAGAAEKVVMDMGTPGSDDEREALADAVYDACAEVCRDRFVAEAVDGMGFEWDGDLKWVKVAKFSDGEFVEVV